jgi:mRNA-degrading endonuclease RelE of RelBE toxin-antitoxin system
MQWMVRFKDPGQVEKTVMRLRPSTQVAFRQAILDLQDQGPVPRGWLTKRLKGEYQKCMSIRLDYRHRMIYQVFREKILILIISVSTRAGAY